jgi:RNA polymerase sigma factor (sigma-70 family)
MAYDGANVQARQGTEQFILDCGQFVERYAERIGRNCRWLTVEDLCSEGMVYVVAHAPQFMRGYEPFGLARRAVWLHLCTYVWQHDAAVTTPRTRGKAAATMVSMDAVVRGTEDLTLGETMAAPVDRDEVARVALRQALEQLTDEQREILLARFTSSGCNRVTAYRSLSKRFGMSARQVELVVSEALAVVRRELVVEVAG